MGLLAGFVAGAVGRTIGGAVNRFQDAARKQQVPVIPKRDTLIGARVGPMGGTLTVDRKFGSAGTGPKGCKTAVDRGMYVDQNNNVCIRPGYMVNRKGKVQKRPSMNVANPRAAVRALRRVKGFEKIARQIIKVTPKFKSKPTYRGRK